MPLKFQPQITVAEPAALGTISAAIEANNRDQKQQMLTTTLTGSRFLDKLAKAADLTNNFDTVNINEINKAMTLVLLEAGFYKENLKLNLDLIEDLKLKIQLANKREWYRDFIAKHPHRKGE